jgi:hypothetical protein
MHRTLGPLIVLVGIGLPGGANAAYCEANGCEIECPSDSCAVAIIDGECITGCNEEEWFENFWDVFGKSRNKAVEYCIKGMTPKRAMPGKESCK